jgi:phosphatidylinositol-3-phosphatase
VSYSAYTSRISAFFLLCASAAIISCGGGGSSTGGTQVSIPANQPTFSHVAVVLLENHSFSEVIGNSSMPYFNSLAQQYGLAAQYYANVHPSLPNYFMLTVGQLEAPDDSFASTVSDDNVVRELTNAGKSWKCYAEALPSPGYMGGDAYPYVHDHNPFTYLSDVQQSSAQAANIVPFTQFASDLANNGLPQYSFIVPDLLDDAHDGTLAQADAWLKTNIAPLIADAAFQNSGLLVITFDEGDQSDSKNGGGQVATVIVSTQAKKNYTSQTLYQHQSTLRLMLLSSGVSTLPGAASTAPDMDEFFTGH